MRARVALAGAALLAVSLVANGSARPPSQERPISVSALRPVIIDREVVTASPLMKEPSVPAMTRPPVTQPEVAAKVEIIAPATTGHSARGVPTYYCRAGWSICTQGYPDVAGDQMYAAAGPSLRVGNWRGRVVTVTASSGKSVKVKLIDWCACGGSHFIDLYYDAFKLLGFPSWATVSW